MKMNLIEDTYVEAFDGIYCRLLITAEDNETLRKAAEDATSTPSEVIGRLDCGIEGWVNNEEETPDNRKGAILQFWKGTDKKKTKTALIERFEKELSYRIRQDILVKPFTSVFDALNEKPKEARALSLDMMNRVGHCGDGFEWEEERYGRKMIIVPIMVPDFMIERYIGIGHGVSGGNFWYMCATKKAVLEAGRKALKAIGKVEGVITPFDICSAGSKPETQFPWIGPTTNHPYCPSLKEKLGRTSLIPENVKYIPEIVINGTSMQKVKTAIKAGIEAALDVDGVVKISAGNYEGKLGNYKIYLHELFA
ncbi:MAG: formylmethanofuran--tetrahydromethanopterin N-formyltransferase [Candidatus Bathyarchaeota archaeon]|jgi:formylmethanofuran--tetrahydromethanopterin N-formyltransferase